MAQQTIQGSDSFARKIKHRRNELGLTIEEAASRAGVGTKTWCRYEAGGSIRKDKCRGVCRAMNWNAFPDTEEDHVERFSIEEYKNHDAWSEFLEKTFSETAALSFAVGSDILLDHIQEDMSSLSSMPAGSHIGQLDISWLKEDLPEQFLMKYDYEFLFQMKCKLNQLRGVAKHSQRMSAHSVLEEILIYLCNEEAKALIELSDVIDEDETEDWVFDFFDDMDIVTYLYSGLYLDENHIYHFSHWAEDCFYLNIDN